MSDRELLELAAKAADIKGEFYDGCFWTENGTPWNPLFKDGAALRLVVKLQMRVIAPDEQDADCVVSCDSIREAIVENGLADPYAATRRAIVRAAAEIGKAMTKE